MTPFRLRMLAASGAITVIFLAMVLYVGSVAPKMARDSGIVVKTFYARCQARDYKGASALLSTIGKESITPAALEKEWRRFAVTNGPLKRWETADKVSIAGFGGSVCVFPPFVDFRHGVFGEKETGTLCYIRAVPENGAWKVERFTVLR
jgi:hypothetical protein